MNDMRQIQVLLKAFTKEKEKYLFELSKINMAIEKKSDLILKMQTYKQDYFNENNLTVSKAIPALIKNFHLFMKKLELAVKQAEDDLVILKRAKQAILERISEIDKKMELMNLFAEKIKKGMILKEEKTEQSMIDDVVSTVHLRGEHG